MTIVYYRFTVDWNDRKEPYYWMVSQFGEYNTDCKWNYFISGRDAVFQIVNNEDAMLFILKFGDRILTEQIFQY